MNFEKPNNKTKILFYGTYKKKILCTLGKISILFQFAKLILWTWQTPISKKSNSAQNYLVTITLVLFVQIKWFLSLNWNSKRELSPRLESPHLELCSLSYSHFYISVQSPLNLHFYHLIHPFYAKIHLIKSQEISHLILHHFLNQFPHFPSRFNPRRS